LFWVFGATLVTLDVNIFIVMEDPLVVEEPFVLEAPPDLDTPAEQDSVPEYVKKELSSLK
jgi:hypothetical protein